MSKQISLLRELNPLAAGQAAPVAPLFDGGSDLPSQGGMSGWFSRQKNLLGIFLGKFLQAADLSPAELCRRLDVAQPQLAQWLSGHNSIPSPYLTELAEALFLDPTKYTVLSYINNIVALRLSLERILTGGRRRNSKISANDGLAGYLSGGKSVFTAILGFCEEMATKDLGVYPAMHWSEALHKHVKAAFQVAQDIDNFLRVKQAAIFSPRNITAHLQYPYNYHVGFYLSDINTLELPNLSGLQGQLWESIFDAARGLSSDDMLESRTAQHATHMIQRYGRLSSDEGFVLPKKMNLETYRMALFGRVYKDEDTGDFERLTHAIKTNEEFSALVLAFDGLHYGDYSKYTLAFNERLPEKAFMRHLNGLGSTKAFLRNLSAARLNTMMERFGERMTKTPLFVHTAEQAKKQVAVNNITEPDVEAVFCKVDSLLSQTTERI